MNKINLSNATKVQLLMSIFMAIYSIFAAIFLLDFTWIICATLWIEIAVMEYFNSKSDTFKEEICKIQNDFIYEQDKTILKLLEEQEYMQIIKLEDIKIPKEYKTPRKEKMKERINYFKKYKNFKATVVVDKTNNLKDGFTSYLIAKQLGFNYVYVRKEEN